MTCKYLSKRTVLMPPEVGGSPVPSATTEPACRLGREPGIIGWAHKCEETPENGPCWYWVEEHGTSTPDRKFDNSLSNRTTR